jgi:hypothetical protein
MYKFVNKFVDLFELLQTPFIMNFKQYPAAEGDPAHPIFSRSCWQKGLITGEIAVKSR